MFKHDYDVRPDKRKCLVPMVHNIYGTSAIMVYYVPNIINDFRKTRSVIPSPKPRLLQINDLNFHNFKSISEVKQKINEL